MRTERLTILVSPKEKTAMSEMADGFGMSVGELLRYGFELAKEIGSPADLEAFANTVSADMKKAMKRLDEANAAIEETLVARRRSPLAAE